MKLVSPLLAATCTCCCSNPAASAFSPSAPVVHPWLLPQTRREWRRRRGGSGSRLNTICKQTQPFTVAVGVVTAAASNGDLDEDPADFDFASKKGWDGFYRRATVDSTAAAAAQDTRDNDEQDDTAVLVQDDLFVPFEWHSSLSHSTILSCLPASTIGGSALFVGCGTSMLPLDLYNAHGGKTSVVCLDYSQPCVDLLRRSWCGRAPPDNRTNMAFVCGDATRLDGIDWAAVQELELLREDGDQPLFDSIIDKGLVDALMCGEGWNGDVERLLAGASMMLKPNGVGVYVLVSYKLAKSTKDFLVEVGSKVGLRWTFDFEDDSNTRVSFSRAVRV